MKRKYLFYLIITVLCLPVFLMAQSEGRLLRFPDIYENQVVFMYGGDLWTVDASGGMARKLTSSPGLEILPKFSPDGSMIAFTAQYDGNFNLYEMPAEGGQPKQLTFLQPPEEFSYRHGPENMILDWYPDSKSILFLSRRYTWHDWFGNLFSVSINGGTPEKLALLKGGLASFNADGTKMAYNRKFRNFRTWKRYTGGLAQDIWIYDFANNTTTRVTDWVGTDTEPNWIGDKIYFTSDRPSEKHPKQKAPGRANIWEYDLNTKQFTQRTFFEDYDVKWASAGKSKLIFENGGYLYTLDITKENTQPQKLTINLPGDRLLTRPEWKETQKMITTYNLAPTGNRAVFEARGDIYTVPKEHGDIRNLTQTSGIREKYPVWSPDGQWIAYFSDRHGEDDLYLIKDAPGAQEVRITTDANMFRYPPIWSPDSKKLAFSDKAYRLWYVDINKKKPVFVDSSKVWEIHEYRWSPDSKWLAYTKQGQNQFQSIYLYNLPSKNITQLTSDFTNDWSPTWDPDGKYFYFLSDRNLNPTLGSFDFTYNYHRTAGIYLTTLQKDTLSPFKPKSDEVKVSGQESKKEEKPAQKKPTNIKIDFDGIRGRMVRFPVEPNNYESLHAASGAVFYLSQPTQGLAGKAEPVTPKLHAFDMNELKDVVVADGANSYDISPDHKFLIYVQDHNYSIAEAKPMKATDAKTLDLSGMKAKVDFKKEWQEIYEEAWRYERDYFYNPKMNNVDWSAIRKKYEVLIPYLADRYDLNYVIGEMIGELSNSHTYVGGGDYPEIKKTMSGMLGVDLTVDDGYYRIKKIYPGDNTRPDRVSPLTKPGVNVPVGSYILAVNGKPVHASDNFYSFFENTVGQQVELTVNSKPTEKGAWKQTVVPIGSEYEIRHWNWINSNRQKVDSISNGQIGYIYLSDMGTTGLNEFVEQFYPQVRKKGLIIDERYNGGGFVDQLILERLRRVLIGMSMQRSGGLGTEPPEVMSGYMVTLINGYSASDGDIFPYYFRQYGLGELIGERTWGGVRGIRGYTGVLDQGYITMPEFSEYTLNSTWDMENYGVPPDIEVDNRPDLVVSGQDPQLEKAVQVLLQKIKENPDNRHMTLPPHPNWEPPYPEVYYKQLGEQPPK